MAVTDPIADFLNRIKNAQKARSDKVDIPASRMKTSLALILKEEGYVKNFKLVRDDKQGILHGDVPRILNGLGITILSTSKGVITGSAAQKLQVGGELLCAIW
jgi:small subunit ribosomal protein S8